jgi:hypothetical protein
MFRILKKKRIAVPLATVAALVIAGAAVAYFTSTGSGTGSAKVGNPSNWAVTVSPATGGALYPGHGTDVLTYTVNNPSSGQQNLSSVTATVNAYVSSGPSDPNAADVGDVTQGGNPQAGCLASWFTPVNTPPTPLPNDMAGGATVNGSVSVSMTDAATSQNACQGVNPDITVNAS